MVEKCIGLLVNTPGSRPMMSRSNSDKPASRPSYHNNGPHPSLNSKKTMDSSTQANHEENVDAGHRQQRMTSIAATSMDIDDLRHSVDKSLSVSAALCQKSNASKRHARLQPQQQSDATCAAVHRNGVPPTIIKRRSGGASAAPIEAEATKTATYAYRDFSHIEPPPASVDEISGAESASSSVPSPALPGGTSSTTPSQPLFSPRSSSSNASAHQRTSIRLQRFPTKLYDMLLRSKSEFAGIISWMPHGRSWRIDKPHEFEAYVMPHYFEHCNYHSFNRLVNAWSFRRISRGPDKGSYYHELFLRGKPHLHAHMHRLSRTEKKRPMPSSKCGPSGRSGGEPDFYAIAEVHPLPDGEDAPPPLSMLAGMVPSHQKDWRMQHQHQQQRAEVAAARTSSPSLLLPRPNAGGSTSAAAGTSPVQMTPSEALPPGVSDQSSSLPLQGQQHAQLPPPPLHQCDATQSSVAALLQQQRRQQQELLQGGTLPSQSTAMTASLFSRALQIQQQQLQLAQLELQQQQAQLRKQLQEQNRAEDRDSASGDLSEPHGPGVQHTSVVSQGESLISPTTIQAPALGPSILNSASPSTSATERYVCAPPVPSPSPLPAAANTNANASTNLNSAAEVAAGKKIPDTLLTQPYAVAVRQSLSSANANVKTNNNESSSSSVEADITQGAQQGGAGAGEGVGGSDPLSLLRYQAQLQAVLEQYRAQRALSIADAAYFQAAAAAAAAVAAQSRHQRLGGDGTDPLALSQQQQGGIVGQLSQQQGQQERKEGDITRVPPPRRPFSGNGPNQTRAWGA